MRKLIGIFVMVFILTSCQSKPENVKQEVATDNKEIDGVIIGENNQEESVGSDGDLESINNEQNPVESQYKGFEEISLFSEYLIKDRTYDIKCLGRMLNKLYFVIEDLDLTTETGSVSYELYTVSYDTLGVTSVGTIDCDYIPRDENEIFMKVPISEHDVHLIMIYSEDSIYFYTENGMFSHSYVVFGDGDTPWNNNIEVIGELNHWFIFDGMSVLIYQDDEGYKSVYMYNNQTELIDVDNDIDMEHLQTYIDELFEHYSILIDNNLYDDLDVDLEVTTLSSYQKVLYEDQKQLLLLMEDEDHGLFYLKSIEEPSNTEVKTLEFEISTVSQNEDANMIIETNSKLPEPHWSDDLQIRLIDVYDPALEQLIKNKYPNASIVSDGKDIIFQVQVENTSLVEIPKDMFLSEGYELSEDIYVSYLGSNLRYTMKRWNFDMSEMLLYARDIEDDYIKVEYNFLEAIINHERIEEAIIQNITYRQKGVQLPDIDFEWLDEQRVLITVSNMIGDTDYIMSLNGYITENGSCQYTWYSNHGNIGALEEYYDGDYDFTKIKSDSLACVDYDLINNVEEQIGVINNYNYSVGTSVGNLVSVALPDEYGYYSYVYDMDGNEIYDNDRHTAYYHDYFEYNEEMYFIDNTEIYRVKKNGDLTSVFKLEGEANIYTVRKHPEQDIFCVIYDRDYKDIAMYILDSEFSIINEVSIDFYRLGFYGMLIEPYWLDEDSVMITGGIDQEFTKRDNEFNTKVFNVNTGEIEKLLDDEKLMTISDNGDYVLMQNVKDGNEIKVYNNDLELLYDNRISTRSDNSSYQYMDYWYGDILYLKYYDDSIVYKWNLSTNEIVHLELPYEEFVISKILGEDHFKLFLNMRIIGRSNPWWS